MVTMKPCRLNAQKGVSLIEVLVTLFILTVGLLGLAGLQARLQVSEMESYQRAQALILLNDMAGRLANNRNHAADYVTASALGVGMSCPTAPTTRQQSDASEWCNALQGAAETTGSSKVGAMVGGRGCVESLGNNEYLITVAWQGMAPLTAPSANLACGQGSYDGATGSACTGDRCRRVVTSIVRIATL
mgnify:FL=1|jgi:type IV pilus assembly protein PilV